MDDARAGLRAILVATAVAGVASYLVTWFVPRVIGFAEYASFAVFWAALYLLVGTLSGLQQEVTRATVPVDAPVHANRARTFGLVAAAITLVLVLAAGWTTPYALPLAVGAASYALVAVLAGSLYGLARWRAVAALVLVDALLRLAAILVVLLFTHDVVALAWAAAVPFGLALVVLWPFIRRSVVGRAQLDVGYRRLSWNVSRTLLAAASTGVMVSGFPLLLGLTSAGADPAQLGLYILAATLVRAPLVVVAMSLQSYLLIVFRDAAGQVGRRLLVILCAVAGAAVLLAGLAWLVGPAVFGWLFPGEPTPQGWFVAALVVSSALVAAMFVSGSAVLARAQHFFYSAGWVAGALVTIVVLVLPLELETRTIVALVAGPLAGLAVHLGCLLLALRPAGLGARD